MEDMGEVIDVDSYAANKAAGKMKQVDEVTDSDIYAVQNTDAVRMSLYPKPENLVVDSYANSAAAEVQGKINRDPVGRFSCSNTLIIQNSDFSDRQEPAKDDCEEDMQAPKKPKLVTTTDIAPVLPDQWVPDYVKTNHHVIEMGDAVYDAMLTQTNLEQNTNDFFVIQVLKANNASSYMVYNRWGRVGERGVIKFLGPHSCCFIAMREFEEIFYEKTKNYWSSRQAFVSYPKCYTWLEMDYRRKEQGELPLPSVGKRTFGPRVERFMSLICNFSMMTQQMTDIGYDAEKLPLQNLSKSTILKAYDVLKLIAEVIGESNSKLLEELSGEFYTIIPHDFGNKRLCEFIIDTPPKLRSKLEMVESLSEIEHAAKLLGNCAGQKVDVMCAQYHLLRCVLAPVEATSKEFEMIKKYMTNTAIMGSPEIVQIFRVSKEGENERFKKYAHLKNRMLLWHGSRLTNWLGILSQGLRIAPSHVPLTGSKFGRGLYFADMFSKSAMYSFSRSETVDTHPSSRASPRTGVLLLCEVALGDMLELATRPGNAHQLPPGKLSTKAIGGTAPSEFQVQDDGVIIPIGKAEKTKGKLFYNEYIVYNEDQVRMRYLVQVDYK